ncbi:MAG: dockerin type I domain-containing protein [Phycisphaerales bacterium]
MPSFGGELFLLGLVPFSYAEGVTADGTRVIGSDSQGCWLWTRDAWVVPIEGSLAFGNGVGGRPAITDDGALGMVPTLVGTKTPKAEATLYDILLNEFDPAIGNLGFNCDISRTSGWNMTPNASHVCGLIYEGVCAPKGYVWDAATDSIKLLPTVYIYKPTRANDVSDNGAFACGWNDDYSGFRQGCVWKLDANGNYVGTLLNTGVATSKLREAGVVSGDGVWAYGMSSTNTGGAPYRWSYATGYQPIAPIPSGASGTAFVNDSNYDGSKLLITFGYSTYVWIADRGYVSLKDWCAENGYELTEDWVFRGFGMTDDAMVIVGDALRLSDGAPSPFVLDLRAKGQPCTEDLDGDGQVGASDLALVLGAWGSFGGSADIDGDGQVGASDLALVLGAWGGCL